MGEEGDLQEGCQIPFARVVGVWLLSVFKIVRHTPI